MPDPLTVNGTLFMAIWLVGLILILSASQRVGRNGGPNSFWLFLALIEFAWPVVVYLLYKYRAPTVQSAAV